MNKNSTLFYHFEALFAALVWGVTFVSTKVLMNNHLTPEEIMMLRFLMAYIFIWFISPHKLFSDSKRDELMFLVLGLSGGSLYFWAENSAVDLTPPSTVSILISIIPLLTAVASSLIFKSERLTKSLIIGALISMFGIIMVVYNEHSGGASNLSNPKYGPLGDFLCIVVSVLWVIYSIVLKKLQLKGYSPVFITRKVFFYGVVTIIPMVICTGGVHLEALTNTSVIINLCFLGFIASFLCFLMFNHSVSKLGPVKPSNYLYLSPLATFIAEALMLNGKITAMAILGSALILLGVYFSQQKPKVRKKPALEQQ